MSTVGVLEWGLTGGVLVGVASAWVIAGIDEERRARLRLLARRRARRARGAALEAALHDPAFAPENVRRSIGTILELAGVAWRSPDGAALDDRRDGPLIRAWAQSREAWLGTGLRVIGVPAIDLLRVVNREDEVEDRIVARVRFRVHRDHPAAPEPPLSPHRLHLDERWTLCRDGERWLLVSVAGDPLAGPVLSAPLIPSPAYDTQRLEEASLSELAGEPPVGIANPGELYDHDAPAPLALLDLSLSDGRFSPLLIAAGLSRIVEAWETASDGSEEPLTRVASKAAIRALLNDSDGDDRRFIRDATLEHWQVVAVDAARQPPAVTVSVVIKAASWTENHPFLGSDRQRRELAHAWALELHETRQHAWYWRLATSSTAANTDKPTPSAVTERPRNVVTDSRNIRVGRFIDQEFLRSIERAGEMYGLECHVSGKRNHLITADVTITATGPPLRVKAFLDKIPGTKSFGTVVYGGP
jgi:hypothetical protein